MGGSLSDGRGSGEGVTGGFKRRCVIPHDPRILIVDTKNAC